MPTVVIQGLQRVLHRNVFGPAVQGELRNGVPAPVKVFRKIPGLNLIPSYLIAIGPLPEHAPAFARRTPERTELAG
jgi:hypothetical protein